MRSPLKYIRSYRELSKLSELSEASNFRASNADSKQSILEARRLHAKIYLDRGYMSSEDMAADLTMNESEDPYKGHSKYFIVRDHNHPSKPVIATVRQIGAHPSRGHNSFPTIKEIELYPEMKQAILALDPTRCVEISGLAKDNGRPTLAVMMLYRKLWHHSLREGHHVWIMACDSRVYGQLKFLFGDALKPIGEKVFYRGHYVVPAMLEVHRSIDPLIRDSKSVNPLKRRMKRNLIRFFMTGLGVKTQTLQKENVVASREIAKAVQEKRI